MTASTFIGGSRVSPTPALLLPTSPQSRSPRLPQARVLGNGQPTYPQAGGLAEIATSHQASAGLVQLSPALRRTCLRGGVGLSINRDVERADAGHRSASGRVGSLGASYDQACQPASRHVLRTLRRRRGAHQ